jgi:hypothetical protein
MSAVAGSFPWSKSYSKDGLKYDYATGWHKPRATGWQKDAANNKQVYTRTLYSPDGTKHRIKVYGDYNKKTGVLKSTNKDGMFYEAGEVSDIDKMLAVAEHAFASERKDAVEGCGHIAKLEFAMENDGYNTGVMRVTFKDQVTGSDSDICLFFNVPPAVYGTLKHHALHKTTCGYYNARGGQQQRHLLGVEFWNLVRIRGRAYGAKFPFSYEKKAEGKIVRHSKRRIVSLTQDMVRVLAANGNGKTDFFLRMSRVLKPNDKVEVVVTDEEIAALIDELDRQNAEKIKPGGFAVMESASGYDSEGNAIDASTAVRKGMSYSATRVEDTMASEDNDSESSNKKALKSLRRQLGEKLYDDLKSRVKDYTSSDEFEGAVAAYMADGMTAAEARRKVLQNWRSSNDPVAQAIDINKSKTEDKIKDSLWIDTPEKVSNILYGKKVYSGFVQNELPAKNAGQYTGVVWTPQKLIDFANPTIPGNIDLEHASAYKALIKAKDWVGAFKFLKDHGFRYDYVKHPWSKDTDSNGRHYRENVETYRRIKYAGKDDRLVLD